MPNIDYEALFAVTPTPCLILDPHLVIADVNDAYLDVVRHHRDDLIGRRMFDVFPANPDDPGADGVPNLSASFARVLESGRPDTMALQRYDIPVRDRPGVFEEHWWSPINTPVPGPDGTVAWIIHRVEDVTAFVRTRRFGSADARDGRLSTREEGMETELYARARELQRLNEELRRAHTRERQVAVTLQEAMLHSPDLAHHPDIVVRYLPAIGSLNICGDWYDAVDLADGRFSVAVGDVVGHGLRAATVMGMLRSALSAASRAVPGPAQALEVLGLYARSVEGALATTAVSCLVDARSRLVIYSSAGHPPPVLLRRDGRCDLLDQATDPPLGARPEHVPRPQAVASYTTEDTLVLYSDGLIERRDEDIDTGLARLTGILARCGHLGPKEIADTLLDRLGLTAGGSDDIVLVVVRL
ncbi:hypothetical protein GCM10010377_23440 [Streptomyces viridiviolaceus]|uniref:PP2C family protein-serine/threonine phosphatase n=1 Tax=Streptomyces viridiviolaceus TaxID=68282 RepID=A0ABW2DV24_9ACTN|nr:hypothetical protein GCM10010377_23440 [Streptomyces viridiviolaceus]